MKELLSVRLVSTRLSVFNRQLFLESIQPGEQESMKEEEREREGGEKESDI